MEVTANVPAKWRFWPVVVLAFSYPMNVALMMLAIPLYYYQIGVNVQVIGFLAAGTTITYCFSPLLFDKISNKWGRKKSVMISMLGTGIAQSTYLFTLTPLFFFIARMFEGLIMGLFWTNLQTSISESPNGDPSSYLAKYNVSWNSGSLFGYLLGTIVLFFIRDISIVFYIAPFLIISNVCVAILFFKDPYGIDESNSNNGLIMKQEKDGGPFYTINQEDKFILEKKQKRNFQNYIIPVIFPALLIMFFGLSRASIVFLYPIKSELLGFAMYTVYFLNFLGFFTQLTAMTVASLLSMNTLKRLIVLSLFISTLLFVSFAFVSVLVTFMALFFFIGLFNGLIYGAGLKFFVILNIKHKTSKYSAICESITGTMFLIAPIVSGFIAYYNLNLAFLILSGVFATIVVFLTIFVRNVKNTYKTSYEVSL